MVYTRLTLKGFVDPLKPKGRTIFRTGYIGALFDGWEHEVCFWFESSLGELIEKTNVIIIEGDLHFKKANALGDVLQFSEEKVKVHFDSNVREVKVRSVTTTQRESFDRIGKWKNNVTLTEEEKRSQEKVARLKAQMEKNIAAKKKAMKDDLEKSTKEIKNKMLNDDFWNLIDKSRKKTKDKKNLSQQYEILLKELQKLSHPEIFKFYYIFQKKYQQATHYSYLLPIYYIINGGIVSENKYNEFIGWIIAQGRIVYENILRNPDYISSILEYKKPFPIIGPSYDIYSLVVPQAAVNAYKEVNGRYFTNEEYALLNYSQEFNNSLNDDKGENITGLLEQNLDAWANPPNRDIIAEHYPKTFEKFGKWMVTLYGDFQEMNSENAGIFKELLMKEVEEMKNDPNEYPVVMKTTLVKEGVEIQCPFCKKLVNKEQVTCPYCKNSLR